MHRALRGVLSAALSVAVTATAVTPAAAAPTRPAPLTNLAHLDLLTDVVVPPAQPGHSTYRLAQEPGIGMLWVYADRLDAGGYRRTGGGAYDPATDTYSQGAYDADDVSRAAIVYLRQWTGTGDRHSRDQAYQLLRGLTYLQTATGPDAGNVVLWMQPDGTLNPSPTPVETPDPSDSGASYWLARTVWALGEGYAAFRAADPAFAAFLKQRLDLAIAAVQRQVLVRYGQYQVVDGLRVPAWLIVDGADASAEAVLGLSAYVRAGGTPAAATALRQLAAGIAEMGHGDARTWPYGAILPWALSRSLWHAWGAQMPAALAGAATTLRDPRLLPPAVADAGTFTPRLLTATGPVNGWLPAPVDGTQIAYGADARVQGLLAVAAATRARGFRMLAGVAAGWYFGQNPGGAAMYDPATGVTFDGVAADGTVNRNAGAESTIHGLLSMQALDANPDVAAIARAGGAVLRRDGQRVVEAERGTLSGAAAVVAADPAWTGESQWSGGAYVRLAAGGRVSWALAAADQPRLVAAVIDRVPGAGGVTAFEAGTGPLGSVRYGGGGTQGVSAAPGMLLPVPVAAPAPAAAATLTAVTVRGTGRLDALLVTPLVSTLVTGGAGHGVTLLASAAGTARRLTIGAPGDGRVVASGFDRQGRPAGVVSGWGTVTVTVPPGGFAVAVR